MGGKEKFLRHTALLKSINQLFQESLNCTSEEEVGRLCLALAEKLTESKFGFIGEINPEGRFDTIAMSDPGWDACKIPGSDKTIMIKNMEIRGIWGEVLKTGCSLIVNSPSTHLSAVGTPHGHPVITSFLGIPLKISGKTMGMIALANKEGGYLPSDLQAVEELSFAFIEALQHKRKEIELQENQRYLQSLIESLQEREQQLKAITESTSDAIIGANCQGKIIFWNIGAKKIFGYEEDEIIGKSVQLLLPEHLRERDQKGMEEFLEKGTSPFMHRIVEQTCQKKDGTQFPAAISRFSWRAGDECFIGSVIRDISELKQAEGTLKRERDFSTTLIQASPTYFVAINPEGKILMMNEYMLQALGYSAEEVQGKDYLSTFVPEDEQEPLAQVFKTLTTEHKTTLNENHILTRDGRKLLVEWHGRPVFKASGELDYFFGVGVDITDRKKAEEALKESEERFRLIMENANDAIFFVDSQGLIRFFNRKAEELYGYSAEEVLGQPFSVLVPPSLKEIHTNWIQKYFAGNNERISGRIVEGKGLKKDGREFFVETSTAILKQRGETYLVAILRDITERKKAEEEKTKLEAQLRQSQKMEAIGLLAGGIAHDFNNILTAIIGYVSLLQMKLKEDPTLNSQLKQILSSAQRAVNLTQSLLAFSRKQLTNPKLIRVNELILRMEKMLSQIIGEDIELKTNLTTRDTSVLADPNQIEQVLLNLATNARDAMPQGGTLTLETELTMIDESFIKTHGYGKPGTYVLISISDTGKGIDAEILEKIFEPFFTTKDVGKGTGLGLSVVYGIVKQHQGYINCESKPGRGTTFRIYLPSISKGLTEEKKSEETISTKTEPQTLRGSETILLAEDDSDVRRFIKEVLENFGYTVLESSDGEEALQVFKENQEKIQLLLLDVIMPRKNGKEVFEEIKKIQPQIRALFLSGYTANIIHKRGILDNNFNFIMKPVAPKELLKRVKETLAEKR